MKTNKEFLEILSKIHKKNWITKQNLSRDIKDNKDFCKFYRRYINIEFIGQEREKK